MIKKILVLILCGVMCLSCQSNSSSKDKSESDNAPVPEILGVKISGNFEQVAESLKQRSGSSTKKYVEDYDVRYYSWEGSYNSIDDCGFCVYKKADSDDVDWVLIDLFEPEGDDLREHLVKSNLTQIYGNPIEGEVPISTYYPAMYYWKVGNGYIAMVLQEVCHHAIVGIEAAPNQHM